MQEPPPHQGRSRLWPRLLMVVGIPLFFFLLSRFTPFLAWMTVGLEWITGLGAWGFFAFAGLYVLVCISAMPDVYLNLAGGMIWGPLWGALAVSVARVFGGSVTFLLVRTLLREHGMTTSGPAPFTQQDRSHFLQRLEEAVQASLRGLACKRLPPFSRGSG